MNPWRSPLVKKTTRGRVQVETILVMFWYQYGEQYEAVKHLFFWSNYSIIVVTGDGL